jgi:hypothetical protein
MIAAHEPTLYRDLFLVTLARLILARLSGKDAEV